MIALAVPRRIILLVGIAIVTALACLPQANAQDEAKTRGPETPQASQPQPFAATGTIEVLPPRHVAAFEILVHPGGSGRADLEKVFDLLEKVLWIDRRCGYRRFKTGTPRKSVRRNLACWIYKQMYTCRNNFLHGNPVEGSDLMLPKSRRPMNSVAPTLYRLGLTSFLDLSWKEQLPPADDAEAFAEYFGKRWDFVAPQRDVEEALQLSRVSLEQQRRKRQALREQQRRKRQEARLRDRNNSPS